MKTLFLSLFILLLAFLIIFRPTPPVFLQNIFAAVARPFLLVKNKVAYWNQNFIFSFYSKVSLIKENETLRAQLAGLQGIEADRTILLNENQALKESYGVPAPKNTQILSVILKPPSVPYDTFILSGGADRGIEKGSLVSAGADVLLGDVLEVYGSSSKAQFFSSSGRTLQASLGLKNIPVALSGIGGGNFEAKLPKATEISPGDPVFVLGDQKQLVGVVVNLIPLPNDSYETVEIRVPVNLFELSNVSVRKVPVSR